MTFNNIPTLIEWQTARGWLTVPPRLPGAAPPPLVRIDELIAKYHKVFDVSKLNILMELKTVIADWAAASLTGTPPPAYRLEAMQALMEIVVRKLYELDGWGKRRYVKAACLGYVLSTGAYDENKVPAGPDRERSRQKDEAVEVGGRVSQLIKAIRSGYSEYQGFRAHFHIPDDEDRATLKIFMAPEFFFRGPYGAYRDIAWSAKILSMLRTETSKPQYGDWLFVHGTALFSTDKEEKRNGVWVKVGNLLENYALVQKGGPKTSEHHDLIVAKEFPSHVDFKHPSITNHEWFDPAQTRAKVGGRETRNIMPEGGRADPIHGANPSTVLNANTQKVSELVGGTIFTMDGILFGLEVCRDHLIGRLAHSHESGKVQIQLVPSCGASIAASSISCINDGIVFNVDGDPGSADVQVNSGGVGGRVGGWNLAAGDGNTIVLFETKSIPWPGRVRTRVARQLNMSSRVLSGTKTIAPPPPPPRNYPGH
jgi:hypothetical protein